MQRVVPYKTSHIPQVASIHCNQIIIGIIILPCHLTRRFAHTGNGMVCQFLPSGWIDRVAHFFRTGRSGGDFELFCNTGFFHKVFHNKFRHGTTADIPQTDEQDSGHFLSAPLGNRIPLSGQYWNGLFPALPERNEKHTLHQLCKDIRPARRMPASFGDWKRYCQPLLRYRRNPFPIQHQKALF